MTANLPKYLYRYMAFPFEPDSQIAQEKIKRLKALFVNSHFYMVSPLWFNDPFDCKAFLTLEGCHETYWKERIQQYFLAMAKKIRGVKGKRIIQQKMFNGYDDDKKAYEEWLESSSENMHRNLLPLTGILSFSESPRNILMWSHYSDSHKGLCVQIDTATIKMDERKLLHKVEYCDGYPTMKEYICKSKEGDPLNATRMFLSRKSKAWEYEREWRLIVTSKDMRTVINEPFEFHQNSLSSVILGCDISDQNKKTLENWVSERGCPLKIYHAVRSKSRYAIDIDGLPEK